MLNYKALIYHQDVLIQLLTYHQDTFCFLLGNFAYVKFQENKSLAKK